MKVYSITWLLVGWLSVSVAGEIQLLRKGQLLVSKAMDSDSWKITDGIRVTGAKVEWTSAGTKVGLGPVWDQPIGDHILEYTFRYKERLERNQLVYNDSLGHAIIIELGEAHHKVWKWPDQNVLHRFKEIPDLSSSTLNEGVTYTVMVEMCGRHLLVHLDDGNFLFGENHRIAQPKTRLMINFEGGNGNLESLRIWEGVPHANIEEKLLEWRNKKAARPAFDFAKNSQLEFEFRVANLRRNLRDSKDPEYLIRIQAISDHMERIKKRYWFYGEKRTNRVVRESKKARDEDPEYRAMLRQLAALEKVEIAFLIGIDSRLAELDAAR